MPVFMNLNNKKRLLALTISVLFLSTLACNIVGIRSPAPSYTVASSAEALQSFNDKWRNLSKVTPNGPFSMTFTEAELTSAVNAALQNAQTNEEPIPVENLQVLLRSGTISVFGQVHFNPLTVAGQVDMVPSITPEGQVALTIVSVDFGPLEVDDTMLDELITRLERSINDPIQASPLDITLSDINVEDSQITVAGTITP